MSTNPIPAEELPSAVAALYDVLIEDGRTLRAVDRMVVAMATLLIDTASDRLGVCDHLRRVALDPIPQLADGSTDAAREGLERTLAMLEAYAAKGPRL